MNHIDDNRLIGCIHDELTKEQSSELESHIAQCPQCGAIIAGQRALHSELAKLEALEPSSNTTAKVMEAIIKAQKIMERSHRVFQLIMITFGALIAVILIICASSLLQSLPNLQIAMPEKLKFFKESVGSVSQVSAILKLDPFMLVVTIIIFCISCLYLFYSNFKSFRHQLNGKNI